MSDVMNAAVMHGPGDIRFERVPRPRCPDGGFVLRVDAVGLCGSDIRNLTTDSRGGDYPHIYGHEVVGTVAEVSPGVTGYEPGQRLYVYPEAHCLRCGYCRAGHHEHCTDVESYTARPGGFAQYIAYTARRVERGAAFTLPEGVDPVRASLAEPLSSTYACVENIDVRLGDTVAILGAGPIGVFLAVLSRMRGASKVILVDVTQDRLDKSLAFDIDHRIDSSTVDPVEEVRRLTGGLGVDKAISANPTTAGQQQALAMTRPCGTVVFFGGVPKGALTEIDSNAVHYDSLWVYGHYGANSMQVQRAFELAIDPAFPAEQIITHILPLSSINEAIDLTRTGEALKVVLLPNTEEK
ncbi:alcohol dehydrogenase catalytic domain-containing protein [Propionibacterium australiense]|uniref:Alcohol dehydrogenase GroES-like domain n=1 Tax=Propionibacterium australiense TaxID=119981 RepID=A0A383S8H1_9ACTN|nr:alcohol dehydrogenase catalytic domain-containing protein [Propionibacterium australiense]RLP06671.1 oxidoreductase [Propionibacterium australiense]RLP06690.1 oxidoreductase [Propionibacterium australiense]SYZ34290.1 Alcohol dehydrogenase GroES-like domain [Propionibacterium australiense]VEH92173.1 Sorbitol dehydrogenase [Propionibacterium australiense]